MKISDILTPALIKPNLQSEEKEELFEEMVSLFTASGLLKNRQAALTALREREGKMTTGIGGGLALPHGKLAEIDRLTIALGISRKGVDYEAMDGRPVTLVIMVLAEARNPGPHIEALAEVSRLVSIPGFADRLREAGSATELLDLIRRQED